MKLKLFLTFVLVVLATLGLLILLPHGIVRAEPLTPYTQPTFQVAALNSNLNHTLSTNFESGQPVATLALTPTVVTATGSVSVTNAITAFRTLLGNPLNSSLPGQQPAGRRELTLDGAPGDPFVDSNAFPGDFFNPLNPAAGYGLTRGSNFTTPGTGFRLSGNNFNDVNPTYAGQFNTFSPPRSFAPVGSNALTIFFRVAGAATPATVKGFGLVFSDVDLAGSASLEFFSGNTSLGVFTAPVRSDAGGLSFVGAHFDNSIVTHVRIANGQAALGAGVNDISSGGTFDLVVLDNFMYSEPIPLTTITPTVVSATGSLSVTNAISAFRTLLGDPLNSSTPGQQPAGRREQTHDGAPGDPFVNQNTFPPDFFNSVLTQTGYGLTRGSVFTITAPGTGFRLSGNNFSDVNATYAGQFNTFSPPRSLAPVGNNIMSILFEVAGAHRPATVKGFGLVFSDVDMPGSSSLEFFNGSTSLGVFFVPARSDAGGLSFLGVHFTNSIVTHVRITSGQGALGAAVNDVSNGGTLDLAVLDNFMYSEPQLRALFLPLILK